MRVMVIVKATKSSEAGGQPDQELMMAMGRYNEQLIEAGLMKAGEGLKPSSQAKRVRFIGTHRIVSDGPFDNIEDLIAGFWIWQVRSMEEAIEWVKKCPNPMPEDSNIEIRPIFEIEDFAEADPTGEVRSQEYAMLDQLSLQSATVTPYLFFGGNCETALKYYQDKLGAETLMTIRFQDSLDAVPKELLPPGFETKIMHAAFKVGSMTLFASDGCETTSNFDGIKLTLTLNSIEACRKAFEALSSDGKVDMPLNETSWAQIYGMVTDKFGLGWIMMVPK